MEKLIDRLAHSHNLTDGELLQLVQMDNPQAEQYLALKACQARQQVYGKDVYIRGLIEFTNYCKNDCYYCGIRKSNCSAQRYRLAQQDIMECCRQGYALGFRTFVLQGGDDPYYTADTMSAIICSIKKLYPDCAVTLSVGERDKATYQQWFSAGADRYLLRHETADSSHYSQLHPSQMSWQNRIKCLQDLKEIGYQVGCGFMVQSPGQTPQMLVQELRFLQQFKPQMVGIGPYIPHRDTPMKDCPAGTAQLTLRLLAIIRLMLPDVLLPATTALGTVKGDGRQLGIKYGANVVMPNLSPLSVRKKYSLYNDKISTGEEAAEGVALLKESMAAIGYNVVCHRGDWKGGSI